jgi:hypothetical protein
MLLYLTNLRDPCLPACHLYLLLFFSISPLNYPIPIPISRQLSCASRPCPKIALLLLLP